jgi:N-acetylneuraminic acid mutarotase
MTRARKGNSATVPVESLETRALLHAIGHHTAPAANVADGAATTELFARVNFQPARAAMPQGYFADGGLVFGDRGNGLSYGWDADNRSSTRDRNSALSPDQRYDTLTHTQLYGVRTWELAVPAGTYAVRVVAGDPTATNSTYGFDVEGVQVLSGKPTSAARWIEGARIVAVTDGRLTVSNSAGAVNNKLAFLEVWKVAEPQPQPAATVTVAALDAAAAETDGTTTRNPGRFRFTRTGPTAEPLVVHYTLGGTATPDVDYGAPSGRVTIEAGATSRSVYIYPKWDALAEGTETVTVTIIAGAGYAAGAPTVGTVTIADAGTTPVEQWKTHAPSPVERFEAASAAIGGKIYVFGGYDDDIFAMSRSDVYDPATDRWSRIADMPIPVTHAGVANDGRYVYFAGGFVGDRAHVATSRVLRYDSATNAWTDLTPLPAERSASGLVVSGRRLHFFGGTDAMLTRDFGDHWVLDLDNPAAGWFAAAPLPNPRNHFGYALLNGRIYAIGGQHLKDERFGAQDDVHAYDVASGSWRQVADLPFPRSHTHTATVVLNGRIVLAGGLTNGSFPVTIADVVSYDPGANAWIALPPLPDVRQAAVAQVVGQRLYVITGTPRGIDPRATTWSRQIG